MQEIHKANLIKGRAFTIEQILGKIQVIYDSGTKIIVSHKIDSIISELLCVSIRNYSDDHFTDMLHITRYISFNRNQTMLSFTFDTVNHNFSRSKHVRAIYQHFQECKLHTLFTLGLG